MTCVCGEETCVCYYNCYCRSPMCFCQACITMRDQKQQAMVESPSKQNHAQNESLSRKKSARDDPSNEQRSSLADNSPPGQSPMKQGPVSVFDQGKQTLGSSEQNTTEAPKPPNDDPYPTLREHLNRPPRYSMYDPHLILRKRLSEPAPPSNDPHATLKRHLSQPVKTSNYDPRSILRRQLSQPAPPPNYDPHATLKRRLSEPRRVPVSGNLFSELPSSASHKNPSSTDGSNSSSISIENPFLPSTNKTSSSTTPSTSGSNEDFKSGNSANSRSGKITTPSDSNKACASIEYIRRASEKALPSYESFSSRFITPSDENNNESLGSTFDASENQNIRRTSTDLSGRCAETHTPSYPGTSGASSVLCSNYETQSPYSSDSVPSQVIPQEYPLNLSISAEDKNKISFLHSLELSSRSPSPVPAKQQRMDTMEFSNEPTSEGNNENSESFCQGSSGSFSTKQEVLFSDSKAEGSCPRTRSGSTASMSGGSAYTSCIVQNPSQYTVRPEQCESPMETDAFLNIFDQNLISSLSPPPTSGFFPPRPISSSSQASSTSIITYCNDMNDGRNFTLRTTSSESHNLHEIQNSLSVFSDFNRFSETPENSYLEQKVPSTSCEQTSTSRQSVIIYQSSRLPPQSTSAFSPSQATNPDNISYQAQVSHQASSSTISPSMNLSNVGHFASAPCSETQNPQTSDFIQLTSDVNMDQAFSVTPSAESVESYARSSEHFPHHSQSSDFQSDSSGMTPSQRTVRYKDDETGEKNCTTRSKRKSS